MTGRKRKTPMDRSYYDGLPHEKQCKAKVGGVAPPDIQNAWFRQCELAERALLEMFGEPLDSEEYD